MDGETNLIKAEVERRDAFVGGRRGRRRTAPNGCDFRRKNDGET